MARPIVRKSVLQRIRDELVGDDADRERLVVRQGDVIAKHLEGHGSGWAQGLENLLDDIVQEVAHAHRARVQLDRESYASAITCSRRAVASSAAATSGRPCLASSRIMPPRIAGLFFVRCAISCNSMALVLSASMTRRRSARWNSATTAVPAAVIAKRKFVTKKSNGQGSEPCKTSYRATGERLQAFQEHRIVLCLRSFQISIRQRLGDRLGI